MWMVRPVSRHSCRGCSNWAGPTAATCGSTPAGVEAMPTACADTPLSWSRSPRTSSWPVVPPPWASCCRRLAPCRSCSQALPTRSGPGTSTVWRGPAATPPGSSCSNTAPSGKWLELLKEIAPGVTRVAVIRDAAIAAGIGQLAAIQSVAPSFGVELTPLNVRDAAEIERAVTVFAKSSKGGLILTGSSLALVHRDLIITLAARHKLPAVYNSRLYVVSGGLISYGPEFTDQYRQAAGYVDRILKGEKPADLPVQAPTKYELVINLKTAKAL